MVGSDHQIENPDGKSDQIQIVNNEIGELPPGAMSDSDNENTKDERDPHTALNIILDVSSKTTQHLSTPEGRCVIISESKKLSRSHCQVKREFS